MSDIFIETKGRAGRITLNRPKALNALTYAMCLEIEKALDAWRDDTSVEVVVIDAAGDKAFCAGGDIQEMYDTGITGDYSYGRTFWSDEYRMNAKIAEYPKPIIAFMQGFVMGGGVGVAGHCSHRVVCETSQIAMPEVGIGLVPDVGGTLLLSRAPGGMGEYLALTAARMGPGDALHAGFADTFVPREYWLDLISQLEQNGDVTKIAEVAETPPDAPLADKQERIDRLFEHGLDGIVSALEDDGSDFADVALKAIRRNSPLAMAVALVNIGRAREVDEIRAVLGFEYEYTYRSMEHGDFLEGIRAAIVDKDRNPQWKYALGDVPISVVEEMTANLGPNALAL
ncbi:enoyl-CoA hydratase/isomerase family protein [Maritimibacter dapengensis]|uniref:Enoyl-CoA hydratase/isomerase family protein n=1 Tax=Maritimibacter dapengensis TaxID=2836868 RepID=A0ABS6T1X6_9RHOB|nr:enoyl-CoA hydratase/isomerase family protein [Maritimibacter dapengensis]MBV7379251.1 enoyl-CoA hydratase/isomerase family protein [Maritimibacter dapengensis]